MSDSSGQQQNRYAHLVTSHSDNSKVHSFALADQTTTAWDGKQQQQQQKQQPLAQHNHQKAPTLKETAAATQMGRGEHLNGQQANKSYYYQSFSSVDWREQWRMFKEKTMERVEEPTCQRKLIMLIVCTALLLDNMLYMVIVPIIPDYLRSIGSWSTYTENARWVLRNGSRGGHAQWEQVGGQTVYEGEDSAVGFLFASKAIVQLIANPFSGAIADRIGYEIPMMFGLVVMFLSTMVFACGQTYSVLFLARSLQGVGSAFADTPGIAMLADRFTEEKERRRAQGIAIAFISFGSLVAPPFGSVLYQGAGKEVPFILLSLVCLIDGSLLLLVAPPGTFSALRPSSSASVKGNVDSGRRAHDEEAARPTSDTSDARKSALTRQKSISRRHSMTMSAGGEAPKGTPIEVLLRDPCIACCAGALVVANISLAFLEPTISIWVKSTMPDTEEWQEGLVWLPAFFPHVLGVFATLHVAEKYPHATWKIAATGLVFEGLGCMVVPFCSSFWSLIVPISVICFGVALIDTAILPTLGHLVDTRFTSVYGNVYAIADISYSVSYAVGPIIAGAIAEAIGFTALNLLIAIVTLAYTPSLMMLRSIRDYEPFEADQTGRLAAKAKAFGKFGRAPLSDDDDDDDDEQDDTLASATSNSAASLSSPEIGQRPLGPGIIKSDSQAGASRPSKSVKIVESSEAASKRTNPFQ